MRAYYSSHVSDFQTHSNNEIIGRLTSRASKSGFYQQQHSQTESWHVEINILRHALVNTGISDDTYLLLEYSIPRRAKRIDAVLLIGDLIFVIEFKIGASSYLTQDIMQLEDYCLDLRDFHHESLKRDIIPILVASDAESRYFQADDGSQDPVKKVIFANSSNLGHLIKQAFNHYSNNNASRVSESDWESSEYRPTPTIIEAAQTLYAGKNVREISRSLAGAENLTSTTDAVMEAVDAAKNSHEKLICFITGVPGAGKTLAGLNIVHNRALHDEDLGVFLSGNGPLVAVLSEALARDHAIQENITKKEARRKVSTFIQNVHHFLDAYFYDDKIPVDRVVIFDEAQRAWNAEHSKRKFQRNFSEPEMMLSIMDRHEDWSVIVALIGGGQEINSGEAGLSEWGKTLATKFSHWKILISPQLKSGHHSTGGQCLFETVPPNIAINENESLHLNVSIRSYRAEQLSNFVAHLLNLEANKAREVLENHLTDYPVYFTRSLEKAKEWLRAKWRGTRRIGITASSGERRIKPYGFDVSQKIDVANWFLNPPDDVRSSYYLEDIATEFDIQGLELDWTCVCWGADMRCTNNSWEYKRFKGTKWQNVNDHQTRQYILNKYRVLLTRAREGLIIWVPPGDSKDPTRKQEFYDGIAGYLGLCGIQEIN
jgi:hypothetical protein